MASPKLDGLLRQIEELSLVELQIVLRWVQMQMELTRLRESQDVTEEFDQMRDIKQLLRAKGQDMNGADATLLACRHVQLSGSEVFNARQVNAILQECDCKPSNSSTVMDTLRQRQLLEVKSNDELGKHRLFSLTPAGYSQSVKLMEGNFKIIKMN